MNKKSLDLMFSSNSDDWNTPQLFFKKLDNIFNFNLDPCASEQNTKCSKFFTKEDDGLTKNWGGHTVFMNPPYGRQIGDWIRKAYNESRKPNTVIVCLIPARTDTKYWHDYCMKADKISFVRGRLKFGGSSNSAPFPSAVVVFTSSNNPEELPSIGAYDR